MSSTHLSGRSNATISPEVEARLKRIWDRAYSARTREDLKKLYADWVATYDEDHEAIGFRGHRRAAELLSRYVAFADVAPVLDAGAGTGAAGVELNRLGFHNITAVDLSPEMLAAAEEKGVYQQVLPADLGLPLDAFPVSHFDAAILVGVFSYGQAPAHALDEIVRVVKPGGVVVFTMRTDFHEQDAMGVRSHMEGLERSKAWQLVERTGPDLYLPRKDPEAKYRIWCYRVLETKVPDPPDNFQDAVRDAFASDSKVKRIDHCYIWNSMASRLYDRYIECPEYYLTDCEEEILRTNAPDIVGDDRTVVELGCGSARKIKPLLSAAIRKTNGAAKKKLHYIPIDLSKGALTSTRDDVLELFGDAVSVDPRQGHFDDVLPTIPDGGKVILFFGSSLGNIETLAESVAFLRTLRDRMAPRDRLVVGLDLHKDEAILRKAYEAGPKNRSFFLNMLRRINNELGANIDLTQFEQESTYDEDPPHEGVRARCVNLKLVNRARQRVYVSRLDLEVELREGDAVQVGTSRKFVREDIGRMMELAGLRERRRWTDRRGWFSLTEVVRDDGPPAP